MNIKIYRLMNPIFLFNDFSITGMETIDKILVVAGTALVIIFFTIISISNKLDKLENILKEMKDANKKIGKIENEITSSYGKLGKIEEEITSSRRRLEKIEKELTDDYGKLGKIEKELERIEDKVSKIWIKHG